jgi:hypothetical protein
VTLLLSTQADLSHDAESVSRLIVSMSHAKSPKKNYRNGPNKDLILAPFPMGKCCLHYRLQVVH